MKLNRIGIVAFALLIGSLVAPVSAMAQETINQRLHNQNARIHQGVKSGELTRGEARGVKRDDRAIHLRERADRLTDHGHLTRRERASLNRQLNRNSSRIYRRKHNRIVR